MGERDSLCCSAADTAGRADPSYALAGTWGGEGEENKKGVGIT